MEITYSRTVNYSMELDKRQVRELADHLDITVRQLNKLVEDGELYDEHGDELIGWMENNAHKVKITVQSEEEVEIEEINV